MTKYEWEKELQKNLKRLPDTEVVRALDYYNEVFFDKEESGMSEREIIRSFGNPFDVAYRIVYGFEGTSFEKRNVETPVMENQHEADSSEPIPASVYNAQNNFFGVGSIAATNLNTQTGGSFCTETGAFIGAEKKADEVYDDWGSDEQFDAPFAANKTTNKIEETVQSQPTARAAAHCANNDNFFSNSTHRKQRSKKSGIVARILFFLPYTILMIVLWSLVVGFVAGGIGAALGGIVAVIAGLTHFVQMAAGTAQTAGIGITLLGGGLAAFGVGLVIIAFAISIIKLAVKTTQKYFFIGKHKTGKRNEAHELQYHSNKKNEPVGGTQSW